MALITLENIVKTYHIDEIASTVLHNVSLSVNAGDMLAIVGASGSGKSTLMNIIGLLDKADSGRYILDSRDVSCISDDDLANLRNHCIGFVFQQFNLLPRLNAYQNVALPLTYRAHISTKESSMRVLNALKHVGMHAYAHHKPTQLSGGQQQRIAIARALVGEPRIILADEPTGALDSKSGESIMDLFQALNNEGRTVIIITHDEHVAARATRRITLADGVVIESSNP